MTIHKSDKSHFPRLFNLPEETTDPPFSNPIRRRNKHPCLRDFHIDELINTRERMTRIPIVSLLVLKQTSSNGEEKKKILLTKKSRVKFW